MKVTKSTSEGSTTERVKLYQKAYRFFLKDVDSQTQWLRFFGHAVYAWLIKISCEQYKARGAGPASFVYMAEGSAAAAEL